MSDDGPATSDPAVSVPKSYSYSRVAKLFPRTSKKIRHGINKRYWRIVGYPIDGRRLYQTLANLGDTDPQAFFDWLDADGYEVLGNSGSYAHLPDAAKQCAALERSKAVGA